MPDYDRPSAGTASGFKSKAAWNYGFLAGVRQLREEDEAGNMIIGKTKVPGSLNYVAQAWRQFGDQGHAPEGTLGASGYEDESISWGKLPAACRIREGTDGCVNGTNVNWDYEMNRSALTGRMRQMMNIHKVADGYDGAVGEDNPLVIDRVRKTNAREAIGAFFGAVREAKVATQASAEAGESEGVARARGKAALVKGLAESRTSKSTLTGSDPRSVGGWSSAKLLNRWAAHSRAISVQGVGGGGDS